MRLFVRTIFLLCLIFTFQKFILCKRKEKDAKSLQIGVKYKPDECEIKTKPGDTVTMHYTGIYLLNYISHLNYKK